MQLPELIILIFRFLLEILKDLNQLFCMKYQGNVYFKNNYEVKKMSKKYVFISTTYTVIEGLYHQPQTKHIIMCCLLGRDRVKSLLHTRSHSRVGIIHFETIVTKIKTFNMFLPRV